jgi:Kef-type K+ transport system membrane component KefB/Trk K+ transport system NAD-binding subunit
MELYIQIILSLLILTGVSFFLKYAKVSQILTFLISGLVISSLFPQVTNQFSNFKYDILYILLGVISLIYGLKLRIPKNSNLPPKIWPLVIIGNLTIFSTINVILNLIGLDFLEALVIGFVLSSSSISLTYKILEEKNKENQIYELINRLSIIIQSGILILLLLYITSLKNLGPEYSNALLIREYIQNLFKFSLIFVNLFLFSRYVLSRIYKYVKNNLEIELLTFTLWNTLIFLLFFYLEINTEVSLLIGSALWVNGTNSVYLFKKFSSFGNLAICALVFLISSVFFNSNLLQDKYLLIIIFVLIVTVLKVFMSYLIAKYFSISKFNSLMFSLKSHTISELSLLLVIFSASNFLISNDYTGVIFNLFTILTIIFVIDQAVIKNYLEIVYKKFNFFEDKSYKFDSKYLQNKDFIFIGASKMFYAVIEEFKEIPSKVLVVDTDFQKLEKISKLGFDNITADLEDFEFVENLAQLKPKIFISTIMDSKVNLEFMRILKQKKNTAFKIFVSESDDDILNLYRLGADYVLNPEYAPSTILKDMISLGNFSQKDILFEKNSQIEKIKLRIKKDGR